MIALFMLFSSTITNVSYANAMDSQNGILNEKVVKDTLGKALRYFANEWWENSGMAEKWNLNEIKNRVAGARHEKKLVGKTVVLDPGHGGTNPGAVANQVEEAQINLDVSLKVKDLLEKEGAKVVLTRDANRNVAAKGVPLSAELQARLDIASAQAGDIFVSIHSNSNENSQIKGAMSFYYDEGSKELAQTIQQQLIQSTKAVDKGIVKENFYVLKNSAVPAVLVELGFVTNPQEAAMLNTKSYQEKLAQGIYQGILAYMQ